MIDDAVAEALANQTTTTARTVDSPTTMARAESLDAYCVDIFDFPMEREGDCRGTAEYLDVTINPDGLAENRTPELVRVMVEEFGFSPAIEPRIGNTRALDGTLSAEGEGFTASWTYHPDDGLRMVIERTG